MPNWQISDRLGRTRVVSICGLGILLQDINIILTAKFHLCLPGGYWFLLVTSVLEGLLGGNAGTN
jgi:hypothetical protein